MLPVKTMLAPLWENPDQRPTLTLYEALAVAHPLSPTAEQALQHTLNLLIQSWQLISHADALTAVLFFPYATHTPTPWDDLSHLGQMPWRTAELVKTWHTIHTLTAVDESRWGTTSMADNEDSAEARAARSLQLRHLLRQGYLDMPLVLLTIAEHYGRVITAVEKGTDTAVVSPTLWQEARDIYIPLLASFGLWRIRDSYITYTYQRLHPANHVHAAQRLHQAQKEQQELFQTVQTQLNAHRHQGDFNFFIRQHQRTPGKLLFTQTRNGRGIDEQLNRLVIDAITNTREDCYRLLNLVHQLGSPHRQQFRDYIATPMLNGYQALQTRVEWLSPIDNRPITLDFRIQTKQMLWLNEHGVIAAIYRYPDLYRADKSWWSDLRPRAAVQELLSKQPIENEPVEAENIYVFTPKGEVRILRNGSTAVDFAYDLHTEVGHQCRSVTINHVRQTHGTRLHNGDLVDLHVDPTFNGPNPAWLHVARRPSTRRAIKAALSGANSSASKGRQRLDRYLQALEQESGLVVPAPRLDDYLTQLAQELGLGQAPHLLDMLTRPDSRQPLRLTEEHVISYILERELVGALLHDSGKTLLELEGLHRETTYYKPLVRFCPTCKPAPGAPLLLHRKRKNHREYLTLHRATGTSQRYFGLPYGQHTTCTKSLHQSPPGTVSAALSWGDTAVGHQLFNITVITADRSGLIGDLLAPIYEDNGIGLTSIQAHGDAEHTATVMLTVNCESWDKGHELHQALEALFPQARVELVPLAAPQATAGRGMLSNPYSTGVPISDQGMFFGREAEIQFLRHELDKKNPARLIVMHGHRRTGKTSLAQMQKGIWHGRALLPVYVDLQNLAVLTPAAIYRAMGLQIQDTLEAYQLQPAGEQLLLPSRADFEAAPDPYELLRIFLYRTTAVVAPRRLLIMLDEFNILLAQHAFSPIYRQLRGLTNDPQLTAVTLMPIMHTAQFTDRQRFNPTSPIRFLWEQGVELHIERLDALAARRLVTEPMQGGLEFSESVVNQIIHGTNGNPYLIHIICGHLVEHLGRTRRTTVRPRDLQHVLTNHIYPSAKTYFNFLAHHIVEFPSSLEVTLSIAQAQQESEDWLLVTDVWQDCRYRLPSRPYFRNSLTHLHLYGVVNLRGYTADGWPEQVQIPVSFFRTWVAQNPDELRALVERRNA